MRTNLIKMIALTFAICLLCVASPVDAAGKTKSLQLVTKCSVKAEFDNDSIVSIYKYSYNKNGLFAKESTDNYSMKYTYKGKNLKKSVENSNGEKSTTSYTTKNGLVVKSVTKSRENKVKATYSYKNKKLNKIVSSDKDGTYTRKFEYNKKGQISKKISITKTGKKTLKAIDKYSYDKKGIPSKINHDGEIIETIENSYKNGKLVKSISTFKNKQGEVMKVSLEYTYSKKKVPASYVKNVQAQQKGFLQNLSASTLNF